MRRKTDLPGEYGLGLRPAFRVLRFRRGIHQHSMPVGSTPTDNLRSADPVGDGIYGAN